VITLLAGPAHAEPPELLLERFDMGEDAGGVYRIHPCPGGSPCLVRHTAEHGWEPWVVDGERLRLIADLRPGPEGSGPSDFVLQDGSAYFAATLPSGRIHLFRFDGERLTVGALLPAEVGLVDPLPPAGPGERPHFALHPPAGPSSTRAIADLVRVGREGIEPIGLSARFDRFNTYTNGGFDGGLWLSGVDDDGRGALWFFDGHSLSLVFQPETQSARIDSVQTAGELLLFTVLEPSSRRLYASDGRAVWPIKGFEPGGEFRNAGWAAALGDAVFIVAEHAQFGAEIFALKEDHLEIAVDLWPGPRGSNPVFLTPYQDALWFAADGGGRGSELWRFDGRMAGLAVDLCRGACAGRPSQLVVTGGALWFAANDGVESNQLWRLGPERPPAAPPPSPEPVVYTPRDLRRVHRAVDLFAPEGVQPVLVNQGGRPHFTSFAADEGLRGWELQPWRVGSREAAMVHTEPLASDEVGATGFLLVGDTTWLARNPPEGPELRPANRDGGFPLEGFGAAPTHSVAFGDAALFLGDKDGRRLFSFDGTTLRSISPAAGRLDRAPGVVVDGVFYFAGRDPEHGAELYDKYIMVVHEIPQYYWCMKKLRMNHEFVSVFYPGFWAEMFYNPLSVMPPTFPSIPEEDEPIGV
jgi:ELWxxDGT repeat protein